MANTSKEKETRTPGGEEPKEGAIPNVGDPATTGTTAAGPAVTGESAPAPVEQAPALAPSAEVQRAAANLLQKLAASAPVERLENPLDIAPNGGRYLVGGNLVDANGQPVKE